MKIAVIDIGTNSARLDIRELNEHGEYQPVWTDRAILRLGKSVFQTGTITAEAQQLTLEALTRFVDAIRKTNTEQVIAVGTSALREAENREAVTARIKEHTGISVEIISGRREAALIAAGILRGERSKEGCVGLIDIGGGSTEITLCDGGQVLMSESFALGALRMQEMFLKTVPPHATSASNNPVAQLRHHVRALMSEHLVLKGWPLPSKLIGSSGTVKSIAKLGKAPGENAKTILTTDLRKLITRMIPLDAQGLMEIPGMESKRTDVILAGALLLDEVLNLFRAESIEISEFTLRDGLFAEAAEARNKR